MEDFFAYYLFMEVWSDSNEFVISSIKISDSYALDIGSILNSAVIRLKSNKLIETVKEVEKISGTIGFRYLIYDVDGTLSKIDFNKYIENL